MYAADFPVLVVLEIHDALCAISGLHEVELTTIDGLTQFERWDLLPYPNDASDGEEAEEWRLLDEGHLKRSVAWEISKKVKQYLN